MAIGHKRVRLLSATTGRCFRKEFFRLPVTCNTLFIEWEMPLRRGCRCIIAVTPSA